MIPRLPAGSRHRPMFDRWAGRCSATVAMVRCSCITTARSRTTRREDSAAGFECEHGVGDDAGGATKRLDADCGAELRSPASPGWTPNEALQLTRRTDPPRPFKRGVVRFAAELGR